MPLASADSSLPTKFPNPDYLTLDNFKRGVITLIDKSRTPRNALVRADNIFLVEDGQPCVRPGVTWFGNASPNGLAIDGFDYFDFNGVIHIVIVAGGVIYRSTDNGLTWNTCTGGSTTAGVAANMNQNSAYLYITTGVDDMLRYDGSTTLQVYTVLSTPAAPTGIPTGLTGTNFTVYYKIAAVNKVGFSIASPALTKTVGLQRSNWDSTSNFLTLTLPSPQTTQERADIYYSEDNINFYYLDSVVSSVATPNITYKDDGKAILVPSTTAPTGNTTKGPRYAELANVGTRMYGVRDPSNRYRIGFTGTGTYSGAFSNAYDGGYLDWQPGGKYIPVAVADYRDGKGTPLATVWCDSADGQGCILQMSLDTLTIQDISITVPSAYKLPGSRGTPAPGSVINVLNDYMFYNSQAFYNLGARAQFLNLLSTDESSGNIRPSVKEINTGAESKIATAYFDAKVYFSNPTGSSTENNRTTVYDTERKAWLPNAFTIGFKKFLRYTATDGSGNRTQKLLCLKPGDNRLSEITNSVHSDYGQAFQTDLTTGLLSTVKNRFEFQFTEEGEIELSQPAGTINIEILGIDRVKGFGTIKTVPVNVDNVVSNAGWDVYNWDAVPYDYTATVPTVSSESSYKRYKPIQRELNAIQWHLSTNSVDAYYVLRTLQSWGTPTEGGKPAPWRI